MTDWKELEAKYFMRTFDRLPVVLVRGQGARVWDETGKEYLDFVAGWAVNCLGHCHPVVTEALVEQARTLIQASNQFYTIPQLQLAQLLVENSCLQRVFFANSGAEANEGAVKLARRYGKLHLKGAYEVITATGSFHGRTLLMTAATGQDKFQKPYTPMPGGFINVPFNDVEVIKVATSEKTCAVMLEPIQGEGGVNIPDEDYLKKVREWCDQKGMLLILDEVQTGMGRVGKLFGYELYGVEPDIMTLAKGMGSGVPIGAMLAKEKVSVFTPGEHGSTFGGNPLVCAAAHATLRFVLDNDIPGNAARVGRYLLGGLGGLKRKFPSITGVRGQGLLAVMELGSDMAKQVVLAALERGLLLNKVKPNAVRFMPPLIIGREEVDQALGILEDTLASLKMT